MGKSKKPLPQAITFSITLEPTEGIEQTAVIGAKQGNHGLLRRLPWVNADDLAGHIVDITNELQSLSSGGNASAEKSPSNPAATRSTNKDASATKKVKKITPEGQEAFF